jgi:hypothetical protein
LVRYELWYSDAEQSGVLLTAADAASEQLKSRDARVVWSVEADTYAEAIRQRDEFLASSERAGTVVAVRRDLSTTRSQASTQSGTREGSKGPDAT